MENDTIPTFPKEWNEKMGINKEEFAYLQENLGTAYNMCVTLQIRNGIYEPYTTVEDQGIYGNTVNLIQQKKNILKDVTPEQVLLAYTRSSMDMSASGVVSDDLVGIGRCILSGEAPTDEIALRVGNMLINNQPGAIKKRLETLRQQNGGGPIAYGSGECGKVKLNFRRSSLHKKGGRNDGPDI